MCIPNLFTWAAMQAETSCCSVTVAGWPFAQPGATPSPPLQVNDSPVTASVNVSDCPKGTAQRTR